MPQKDYHIDYKLLLRLRDGDEKAFSVIFDTYHRYLYVIAYRYLMSKNCAEDAVQFTFMRLWERRGNFDYKTGVKNLLFTILKNYCLNEIRHNNLVIQKNYELAQLNHEVDMGFLRNLEDADYKTYLYELMNQLPPQKRKVCLLKIQKEMSNQEVADTMNISISTVKSHYTQIVKMLRLRLDKIIIIISMICCFI